MKTWQEWKATATEYEIANFYDILWDYGFNTHWTLGGDMPYDFANEHGFDINTFDENLEKILNGEY